MTKYSFKKYQPLGLRLWHWFNVVAIFGLLGTVLLRKTFLSWRGNAALIENKIREGGAQIAPDLAKEIAVSIRNPMWDWHYTLGFILAGALLVRILVGIFVEKKCPATCFLQSAKNLSKASANEKSHAIHYTLVKAAYAFFYLATLIMVVTGLTMYFRSEMNLSKGFLEPIKEIHELMMWFFVVFAAGHIIGVVVAENRGDAGLVSDMINGGEKNEKPT